MVDFAKVIKIAQMADAVEAAKAARAAKTTENAGNLSDSLKESKVRDPSGELMKVYHGSNVAFDSFITTQYTGRKNWYSGELGSWFGDTNVANSFANKPGGVIYPSYLDIRNPKVYDSYSKFMDEIEGKKSARAFRKSLEKEGYDGIHIKNSRTDTGILREDWVAFKPEQIKSAIGNRIKIEKISDIAKIARDSRVAKETTEALGINTQTSNATSNRGTFDPNNPDITQ